LFLAGRLLLSPLGKDLVRPKHIPLILSPITALHPTFCQCHLGAPQVYHTPGDAAPFELVFKRTNQASSPHRPSCSGRLGSSSQRPNSPGCQVPSESGCSLQVLPGCNTLIHSSATVSQRQQLVVFRHYTPLPTQSPAFRATESPPPS
jgi:hypothetical protein